MAKAKQKNLPKHDESERATVKEKGRVYVDISSVRRTETTKPTTKPHWCLAVREATGMKSSSFHAAKDHMVEPMCEKIDQWNKLGLAVTHLRMDNAGENKSLEKRLASKDWRIQLDVEYTAARTPQQNSLVEVSFATLLGRSKAMMSAANVPAKVKRIIYREAIATATKLDGLMQVELNGVTKSRYEHEFGKNPPFVDHLRTWGEAGTVKIKTTTSPKDANPGEHCMMVGYADNHPGDTYRMWNPDTKQLHQVRDVVWLKRMFYAPAHPSEHLNPHIILPAPIQMPYLLPKQGRDENQYDALATDGEETDDEQESDDIEFQEKKETASSTQPKTKPSVEQQFVQTTQTTRSGRASVMPVRFADDVGMIASESMRFTQAELSFMAASAEFGLVGAGLGGGFINTNELHVMKYNEAMATEDKPHWDNAVGAEHDKMKKYQVFKMMAMKDLPAHAKILKTTWAMKKKSNGKYRARLNACGYAQIDGVHYDEDTKAAPVVTDTTVIMMLIVILVMNMYVMVFDVEGAFLNGKFRPEHQVYIKVPQGFEKYYPENVILLLIRTLYGCKQSAYEYWQVLVKAWRAMKYKRSESEPCLYFKRENNELSFGISWVDDLMMAAMTKQKTMEWESR